MLQFLHYAPVLLLRSLLENVKVEDTEDTVNFYDKRNMTSQSNIHCVRSLLSVNCTK